MALTQISTGMLASGDGTVDLNIDNGTFVVDVSTSHVGIGTSSPSRLAHLYGTSNPALRLDNGTNAVDIGIATSNGALLNGSSANDLVIARNGAYNIKFGTNGSTRAVIDSSGNVGIGRTSITQPSSGATTLAIQGTDTTKGGAIQLYSSDDSVAAYIYPDNSNGLSINTSTSHPIIFRTAGTERLRIAASGNIGIGTTSPATAPSGAFTWANKLVTIAGTRPVLYLNGSSSITTLRMWPNGTDGASTSVDDWHVNTSAGGVSTGRLSFTPQGGAIANIGLHLKPDGKVGIGTYTPTANLEVIDPVSGNFDGKIHIGGTGSGRRLVLEQSDVLTYKMGGTGTDSITQLVSGGSSGVGTVRMSIDASGVTTFNNSVTAVGSIGVTQADGDYLVKIHETNADGYVDLFTGEATPVIRTRIASYGTSYFTPTGTTASNQAAVSIGSATGAKAGVLNIDSSSTSIAGGIRHRMGGGTQYLNIASTQTGSGTIPYWHIKTNIYYNNNVMFVARVHGYAYGNAGHIIDIQRSGYAYSGSSTAVIASQFVNNGSGTGDALDAYYTSAGQLCFRAFAGSSSYYTGLAFDIKMQSPTGYNHDFVVEEHVMNATSGNHY